jgi:hypothetical protein
MDSNFWTARWMLGLAYVQRKRTATPTTCP